MAGEKLLRGEVDAAFALELEKTQGLMAGTDDEPVFVGAQDFARRTVEVVDFGLPDFEEMRLGRGAGRCARAPGQESKGAGPGQEATNAVPQGAGRLGPIEVAILLFDFGGVSDTLGRLGLRLNFAGNEIRDGSDEERRPDLGQAIVQSNGGVLGVDRSGFAGQERSGVEADVHFHNGDAGLLFVIEDGPLDRAGPAVFGEERGMNVETAETRHIQEVLGKDLAIGGDGNEVGPASTELFDELRGTRAFRLQDGKVAAQGEFLDGSGLKFKRAPFGPVGLSDHGDHLEAECVGQGAQAGAGKRGGAHEGDAQWGHIGQNQKSEIPGSNSETN